MSYIGAQPSSAAFVTDSFSGNATTTAFTMSVAPANTSSALVAISGVLQDPTTYSVSGLTLTFTSAPPVGTGNISVRYLGIPASGVTTTAYRTVTEFTATAGQTTFSPPSYTVGYINVFRNGVRLASADFTASNGTTVVLTNAATTNDIIMTESFYVSSVSNALPQTGGTINAVSGATPLIVQSNGTSVLTVGTSNVGIGTNSPASLLDIGGANNKQFFQNSGATTGYSYAATSNTGSNLLYGVSGSTGAFWGSGPSAPYMATIGTTYAVPVSIATNNSVQLYIDSNGAIRMPNQPAFFAAGLSANVTSGVVLWNQSIPLNVGSCYSSSTGRFTAPVAGSYLISANGMCPSGGYMVGGIRKNGGQICAFRTNDTGSNLNYAQASATIVINMAANDYIDVNITGGTLQGSTSEINFCGHLIG